MTEISYFLISPYDTCLYTFIRHYNTNGIKNKEPQHFDILD